MHIHIKNVHIHAGRQPAMATALLAAMFSASSEDDPATAASASAVSQAAATAPFKIGEHSAAAGGIYVGVTPGEDGQPDAHLFLLDAKPDSKLSWADGVKWAESLGDGAHMPTRFESALLYANVQSHLDADAWHWTSTQYSGRSAWSQYFSDGDQDTSYEVAEGRCRAVRRLVL
ncbi:MAG: hypothetical protein Q8N13_10970 [Acidovorax sp.]|nr:hypothetical protein [Acidovorax sp.]